MNQERNKHPSYYNRPRPTLQLMSQLQKFQGQRKDEVLNTYKNFAEDRTQRMGDAHKQQPELNFPGRKQYRLPSATGRIQSPAAAAGRPTTAQTTGSPTRTKLSDYTNNSSSNNKSRNNNSANEVNRFLAPRPESRQKEPNRSFFSHGISEVFAPLDELVEPPFHSDKRVYEDSTRSNRNNCLIGGNGVKEEWKSTSHSFNNKEWGSRDKHLARKNFDSRDPRNMKNPLTNEQFGWPDDVMAQTYSKTIPTAAQAYAHFADEDDDSYNSEEGYDYSDLHYDDA